MNLFFISDDMKNTIILSFFHSFILSFFYGTPRCTRICGESGVDRKELPGRQPIRKLCVFRLRSGAVLLREEADVGGVLHTPDLRAVLQDQQGRSLAHAVLFGEGRVLVHDDGVVGDAGVSEELLGHHALRAGGGGEQEQAIAGRGSRLGDHLIRRLRRHLPRKGKALDLLQFNGGGGGGRGRGSGNRLGGGAVREVVAGMIFYNYK